MKKQVITILLLGMFFGQNLFAQISASPAVTQPLIILTASLHRENGTSHKFHRPCGCGYCFGMCDVTILGHPIGGHATGNVMLKKLSDNKALLYFLEQPDPEVTIDPTFYVDHNVTITEDDGSSITILTSNYPYSNVGGTLHVSGEDFIYYGTAEVNIQ